MLLSLIVFWSICSDCFERSELSALLSKFDFIFDIIMLKVHGEVFLSIFLVRMLPILENLKSDVPSAC